MAIFASRVEVIPSGETTRLRLCDDGHVLAEFVLPPSAVERLSMSLKSRKAQECLDVMFEILSRCHARDRVPEDRDELMDFARDQLRQCGIDVVPMGSSHAVIREK